MGVSSLPKTVTRQRRDCDLNPGLSAPESSTLTTRLPSHPLVYCVFRKFGYLPKRGYSDTVAAKGAGIFANFASLFHKGSILNGE